MVFSKGFYDLKERGRLSLIFGPEDLMPVHLHMREGVLAGSPPYFKADILCMKAAGDVEGPVPSQTWMTNQKHQVTCQDCLELIHA